MLAPPHLGHCSNEPELDRASAAAELVAGTTPATPRPRHHHSWMRTSVRIPKLCSARQIEPCGQNPRLATAAGLAGVKPSVGLTHVDHGGTLPCVHDRWGRPVN